MNLDLMDHIKSGQSLLSIQDWINEDQIRPKFRYIRYTRLIDQIYLDQLDLQKIFL